MRHQPSLHEHALGQRNSAEPGGAIAEVHQQVAGLLGHPGADGVVEVA
jgi:hypothetical protein